MSSVTTSPSELPKNFVRHAADENGDVYCTCCPKPRWLGQLTAENGRFYCDHGKQHHLIEQPTRALLIAEQLRTLNAAITGFQSAITAISSLTAGIQSLPDSYSDYMKEPRR